jgi:hypothetical protein
MIAPVLVALALLLVPGAGLRDHSRGWRDTEARR